MLKIYYFILCLLCLHHYLYHRNMLSIINKILPVVLYLLNCTQYRVPLKIIYEKRNVSCKFN